MSKTRSILGLLILLGAATAAVAQSTPPDINVVPRPVSLKLLAGRFVLNPETRIVAGDEESRRIARLFNDYLLEQHGLHLKMSATRDGGRNTISFSQGGSGALPEEGYLLRIEPQSIRVTGRPAGLFYGMQTLTQLMPLQLEPTIELPGLRRQIKIRLPELYVPIKIIGGLLPLPAAQSLPPLYPDRYSSPAINYVSVKE